MRFGRGPLRFARRALALAVAFSVLASLVLAGQRYFYCPQMDEVSLDACCPEPAEQAAPASDDGPALDGAACCKAQRFTAAAPAVTPSPRFPLQAPALVSLAAVAPTSAPALCIVPPPSRLARAGPRRPDAREHRLRLMVSLT